MKTIICLADGGGWKSHLTGGVPGGAGGSNWPEPLRELVVLGEIRAICVKSLYEAAAMIVADLGQNVSGIAIDAGMLTLREAGMIGNLRKIGRVPVWIFPGQSDERWSRKALQEGALRWEDASRVLGHFLG